MANVVITEIGPLYTLPEVKAHLRVDHADDDVAIQMYMDAAEKAVLQYCNLPIVPYGQEAVFKAAALLAVGNLYDNRSTSAEGLPPASRLLVDPHRWLRV